MRNFRSPLSRKKEKIFRVLDIGSESVKFLVVKKEDERTIILEKGLKEYERFGVFDGRDFELNVMKKTIEIASKEAKKEDGAEIKNFIVGLPAHIFKARVSFQEFKRTNPKKLIEKEERERIFRTILEGAKRRVSESFAKESGILPEELHFLSERILQIKIDGYEVPEISGFSGKRLGFKILTTFLPKYYLENFQKLIKALGFKISKILHESEGLMNFLSKDQNVLFLDIGADFTQIFLAKKGSLETVSEFELGGKNFSLTLCQKLGILYPVAKELSERYQKGLLEERTRSRLKEIFSREAQNWLFNLKKALKGKVFFENIYCLGGGAHYPEIEEVLEENYQLPVKTLDIKSLPAIEDRTNIENLQFIPALLLTYAI